MRAVWSRLLIVNCEKLQSYMISAYGTCLAENNICLTFFQNSTYLEALVSAIRQSGPLNTVIISQVNITIAPVHKNFPSSINKMYTLGILVGVTIIITLFCACEKFIVGALSA